MVEEMTDKQIIIDGVDVSGCAYIIPPHEQCPNKPMPYAKETSCFACKEHNTKLNFCKNNPNCYYKQLKAKEQECEELRVVIRKDFCSHYVLGECSQKHHNNCVGRNQCIKDLEQECERWKSNFYGKVSAIEELLKQLDQLKSENEELKEKLKSLQNK